VSCLSAGTCVSCFALLCFALLEHVCLAHTGWDARGGTGWNQEGVARVPSERIKFKAAMRRLGQNTDACQVGPAICILSVGACLRPVKATGHAWCGAPPDGSFSIPIEAAPKIRDGVLL
jgi:hypothetical protein